MPPTQQSTHPNITGTFSTEAEAEEFARRRAGQTGAMQAGERPLNNQEQQAWVGLIDDQIAAAEPGAKRQGLPKVRADGSTAVSVLHADGSVTEETVQVRPQGQ
jgi:hypothetical protein